MEPSKLDKQVMENYFLEILSEIIGPETSINFYQNSELPPGKIFKQKNKQIRQKNFNENELEYLKFIEYVPKPEIKNRQKSHSKRKNKKRTTRKNRQTTQHNNRKNLDTRIQTPSKKLSLN